MCYDFHLFTGRQKAAGHQCVPELQFDETPERCLGNPDLGSHRNGSRIPRQHALYVSELSAAWIGLRALLGELECHPGGVLGLQQGGEPCPDSEPNLRPVRTGVGLQADGEVDGAVCSTW
jgi:hypothetical protein